MYSKTLSELAALTGVKPRTLQFWTQSNVLVPLKATKHGGPGVHRKYDTQEVTIAFIMAELSRYNLQVATLIAVSQEIRRAFELVQTLMPGHAADVLMMFGHTFSTAPTIPVDAALFGIIKAIFAGMDESRSARMYVVEAGDEIKVLPGNAEDRSDEPNASAFITVNLGAVLPRIRR